MRHLMIAYSILLLLGGGEAVSAEGGAFKASCTQGGKVIFTDNVPAADIAKRRNLITARHPDALCIFVDAKNEGAEDTAAVPAGERSDLGLAAALDILSAGEPGTPYSDNAAAAIETLVGSRPPASATAPVTSDKGGSGLASLTIGIFSNMGMDDVVEHWKFMKRESTVLARYAPTFTLLDDAIMVTIEHVPDQAIAPVCEEAERLGSGCVAIY